MQVRHSFSGNVYAHGQMGYVEFELIADSETPFSYDFIAQETVWTFSRALLSDAFQTEGALIGLGDVRTQIDGDDFCLTLESPEGLCTIVTPSLAVLDFIMESDAYIPTQRIDEIVAAELEQFLANLSSEE